MSCRTRPALGNGELHLWSTDLKGASRSGVRTGILSESELERARRVIRPRVRERWLAARVFLRTLLAGYLDEDPRSLRFAVHGCGKPVLAGRERGGLHFNLSHSGSLAVCALSRSCAVGVDVQVIERDFDAGRIGARLLGPRQAAQLDRLAPAERRLQMLRAWTALEAERKRTGLGLGADGERFSGPRPWLARLDLQGAGAGAVALAMPPSGFSTGSWAYFRISDLF